MNNQRGNKNKLPIFNLIFFPTYCNNMAIFTIFSEHWIYLFQFCPVVFVLKSK